MTILKFEIGNKKVQSEKNVNWFDVEEDLCSDFLEEDGQINLDSFKYKKKDILVEITNWESYRPGHVDVWVYVDDKVWLIDDLNDGYALPFSITKQEFLKIVKPFL